MGMMCKRLNPGTWGKEKIIFLRGIHRAARSVAVDVS